MKRISTSFNLFLKPLLSGGILLIVVTVISLLISNSVFGTTYREFFEKHIGFTIGVIDLNKSVLHWINDGLMAVFFLLVGLEIKRELINGELSSRSKAMLPLMAAAGGMIVPALIYSFFNHNGAAAHGWGIPMATDIAFALAVLSMAGNKIPVSLKIFLTALAIIDDLGAVLVIAVFYTSELQLLYLAIAIIPVLILFLLNKLKIKNLFPFLLCGIILWYCILKSGIHATIAGVILAMFIPLNSNAEKENSPLEKLENSLHGFVNKIVLPLFALANTALLINADILSKLSDHLALGIMGGLIIGKPAGIILFSIAAVKLKLASLPDHIKWKHISAAGILGGIGFTMSVFISMLAFADPGMQDLAKVSVLIASVVSGIAGYCFLKQATKETPHIEK